jgi:acetylornithine deacetylase/succinyl-diaminopimelate desuccinylase-like protein
MPDLGINPHYSLARFLDGLPSLSMASHPDYGHSTVAPTRIKSEPQSANVTPATLRLTLDWRNIPGEDADQIVAKLQSLLARCLQGGCRGHIAVNQRELQTYNGLRMSYPDAFGSFTTSGDNPWLLRARAALVAALDRDVELGIWRFATDGCHFADAGVTVLGLGPGDDVVVHTIQERLPLDQLVESAVAYLALALLP